MLDLFCFFQFDFSSNCSFFDIVLSARRHRHLLHVKALVSGATPHEKYVRHPHWVMLMSLKRSETDLFVNDWLPIFNSSKTECLLIGFKQQLDTARSYLVSFLKSVAASQAWSAWKWRWYRLFCDQDLDRCSRSWRICE